jgi:hypothetical protein
MIVIWVVNVSGVFFLRIYLLRKNHKRIPDSVYKYIPPDWRNVGRTTERLTGQQPWKVTKPDWIKLSAGWWRFSDEIVQVAKSVYWIREISPPLLPHVSNRVIPVGLEGNLTLEAFKIRQKCRALRMHTDGVRIVDSETQHYNRKTTHCCVSTVMFFIYTLLRATCVSQQYTERTIAAFLLEHV